MITKEKFIDGVAYLLLDVIPVFQKSHAFYLGKIKASDLVEIFDVDPTHYDVKKNISLSESFVSDADYYKSIVANIENIDENQGFQRAFKEARAREIRQFLETKEHPFFPNTIIASCNLINSIDESGLDTNSKYEEFENLLNKPDLFSFLYRGREKEQYKLLIPKKKGAVLIIDGQHRIKGLEKCASEYRENYELLVSFIIGYDRSVIAQQFYTINYEQKPVNKSLLLHLTGEFSKELDEVTFLHNVVKLLNEHATSPFQKRIKMLGVVAPELDSEERKLSSVSQALLIEYMLRFIDRKQINSRSAYPPIFLYYYQNEIHHINIIRFIIRYFNAIKEIKKDDWENPKDSILSKSVSVGAFLSVLHTIFPIMFIQDWQSNPDKIEEVSVDTFKEILHNIKDINFTGSGEFAGASSAGTVGKIRTAILEKISYNDSSKKEEFRDWLNKSCKS